MRFLGIWALILIIFAFFVGLSYYGVSSVKKYSYEVMVARGLENAREINRELVDVLTHVDNAALARVSIIDMAPSTISGIPDLPIMTWTVVGAKSAPWFTAGAGPMTAKLPLSNWAGYLAYMVQGECRYVEVKNIFSPISREHLNGMGIIDFDVCPMLDEQHNLIGGLFVSWGPDRRPDDPQKYFGVIQKSADALALRVKK